jgi:hypothetical protein
MKRASLIILSVFIITALGAVYAQEPLPGDAPPPAAAPAASTTVTGSVVSSGQQSVVIKTDAGDQMTFEVDGTSMVPAGLVGGDKVSIEYQTLDGGKYRASKVVLSTTSMPAKTTAEQGYDSQHGEESTTQTHEGMPRTASPLPLLALAGSLLVGAAFALRAFSRLGA